MKRYSNKGFTLAEVLVTLAIVGVIAAIAVPTLLQTTGNIEKESMLKQRFAELSLVYRQIIFDNGSVEGLFSTNEDLMNLFADHLQNARICHSIAGDGACWHKANEWYYGHKSSPVSSPETNQSSIIMNNGTMLVILAFDSNCQSSNELKQNIGCGRIRMDINGQASPNIVGRDIFDFYLLKNRIIPRGSDLTTSDAANCGKTDYWACAARVLHGGMDY